VAGGTGFAIKDRWVFARLRPMGQNGLGKGTQIVFNPKVRLNSIPRQAVAPAPVWILKGLDDDIFGGGRFY
jgi:hypothetical protein